MKSKSLMWIQHLWCIHFANLKKSCSLLADEPSSVSVDLSHVRDGTKMIPWKNVQSRKTFIRSQNLISVCEEFCNLAPLLKSSAVDFFSKPRVLRAQVAWNYRCEQRKSVNNPLSKVAVWLRSVPPLERGPLRKLKKIRVKKINVSAPHRTVGVSAPRESRIFKQRPESSVYHPPSLTLAGN